MSGKGRGEDVEGGGRGWGRGGKRRRRRTRQMWAKTTAIVVGLKYKGPMCCAIPSCTFCVQLRYPFNRIYIHASY